MFIQERYVSGHGNDPYSSTSFTKLTTRSLLESLNSKVSHFSEWQLLIDNSVFRICTDGGFLNVILN